MVEGVFSKLSKPLKREILSLEWTKATPIQEMAIPAILEGSNVLLIAPTGTGKTEAAILPVFERFLRERITRSNHGISILYVTPLRALNRDIFRRLIDVGKHLDLVVQIRHGDTSQWTRRKQALNPPDMLITTPETLQAILPGKRMQKNLGAVRWVIVDEIHELATDKRGVQLSVALERLGKITGRQLQRIGLSATVGNSDLISRFLVGKARDCKVFQSDKIKMVEIQVESPTSKESDEEASKTLMIPGGSISRVRRILKLIDTNKSSLVFTNTREHAEVIASRIFALHPEAKVGVHHGSLSKDVRIHTEHQLKQGALKAVICTSSLELGIDVGIIDYIIQYMSPRQVTRLLQRVGRSGHTLEGRSEGCILASWPDDILESVVIAKFASNSVLETHQIHDNALDVLAHQIAGMGLDWGNITLEEIHQTVSKAWPYRNLSLEKIQEVVEQLERRRILWFNSNSVRKRSPNIYRYYYENLSMITDVNRYEVVNFLNRRKIGTLDQEFIAKNGKPGQEFIIHGQTWRIISIDEEQDVVQVEVASQSFGAIPAWEGEMIPVSFHVAQEVGRLRKKLADWIEKESTTADVFNGYAINSEAIEKTIDFVRRQLKNNYNVPTHRHMIIECFENYIIIHGCYGNRVNETLGKALAALLSARFGFNVATQVDAYRIALITPAYVNPERVKKELLNLKPDELLEILDNVLGDTSLLAWRLWNVAKRFGLVNRQAEYSGRRGRMLASALRGSPIYEEAIREIYIEKMDLNNACKVLNRIQDKEIQIQTYRRSKAYSPFSLPILDRIAPHDVLRPVIPTQAILEIVKERLQYGEVRLVCLLNADYNGIRRVRSLPNKVRCPNCGYTMIAATYRYDSDLAKIVEKRIAKKTLTKEEEKRWQTAWKSANLVQAYGKKAIIVLRGRGIGPTSAARILRSYHRSEDALYLDVIKAERNYIKTRMFWDK
jgi:ATP-dependent Lhr-like helicase